MSVQRAVDTIVPPLQPATIPLGLSFAFATVVIRVLAPAALTSMNVPSSFTIVHPMSRCALTLWALSGESKTTRV